MRFDVLVVGGGPAGLIAARDVAGQGYDVLLVEEHPEIGEPVQCSGLFSIRGLKQLEVDLPRRAIAGVIRGGRFFSPGGEELEAYSKLDRAYVVERRLFDKELAKQAARAGARIALKTRAKGLRLGEKAKVALESSGREEVVEAEVVIAADGVRSRVASQLGLSTPRRIVAATQVEVESAEVEEDIAELYFGSRWAPNFYAWLLPKGEVCEVGVCVRGGGHPPRVYLERFMREHPIAGRKITGRSRLEYVKGAFPVARPKDTFAERVLLVGDAGGFVKASTGGGVITGGISARLAARACCLALEEGDFSAQFFRENYERAWKAELGRELEVHELIRRVFDSLSDSEIDALFKVAREEDIPSLMVKFPDTDRPYEFFMQLLEKERFVRAIERFLRLEI
ncbi:MAG: NAD(P)/FAD-dependent oxidoreductase [Euryarchaeota archaeon]|nr:NAD(P)/FAD-dependent oxidoreductase [Euryarchaeota archaeon]